MYFSLEDKEIVGVVPNESPNKIKLCNWISNTFVINDTTCVISLLICDSFVVPLLHPYPE